MSMTTTTAPRPEIPLPAGAVSGDRDWSDWGGYAVRLIRGSNRIICDVNGKRVAMIRTVGVQRSDGSVDDGDENYPTVDICLLRGEFGRDQARELAAVLLQAADEMDGWTQ